jgi:hypothetical protein
MPTYDIYANNEYIRTYKRWGWVVRYLDRTARLDTPPDVTIRSNEQDPYGRPVWQLSYPWFGRSVMGDKIWEL